MKTLEQQFEDTKNAANQTRKLIIEKKQEIRALLLLEDKLLNEKVSLLEQISKLK